jgi:hypothetical protein
MKGLLCATVVFLVLIETLALASGARAAEVGGQQEGAPVTQEAPAPAQEPAPTEEAGTATQEAAASGQEDEAPTQEVAPPAEESPQLQETSPPPQESTPPSPEEVIPTAQEVLPVQEVVPPPVEEALAPVVTEVTPKIEEALAPVSEVLDPIAPTEERVKEDPAHGEALAEPTKEAAQAEQVAAQTIAATPAPSSAPQMGTVVSSSEAEVVNPMVGTVTPIPAGEAPEGPAGSTTTSLEGLGRLTAAQRAGELSCELSGLTVRMSEDCSAGLLSGASLLSVVSAEPVAEASPAHRSVPTGDGYSEPAGGGHSILPPPGPAPGGSIGGSAASGSGAAPSGFFTFAGLRLRSAPCAMRRLRLSCRPWRTAFFVLIPERPG